MFFKGINNNISLVIHEVRNYRFIGIGPNRPHVDAQRRQRKTRADRAGDHEELPASYTHLEALLSRVVHM